LEAIDAQNPEHVREELGDLFLLTTMIAYMYEQEGLFSVADALDGIAAKLVRRHPHVFDGPRPLSSAQVLDNWARIKVEQEGRKPKDSLLDGVSRSLPPLDRACQLQKKAAQAGFDWPNIQGIMDKIQEELAESAEALGLAGPDAESPAVEEELGDLLFSVINLCRYCRADPSAALHRSNVKFLRRFTYVEGEMKKSGQPMGQETLALMNRYWEDAKAAARE
jgi:tetrapyrrole methylase family protein/MazG family protein